MPLNFRNEICFLDFYHGYVNLFSRDNLNRYHAPVGFQDFSFEALLSFNGRAGTHPGIFANKLLEIRFLDERTIETG